MAMTLPNRITLAAAAAMPLGELAALSGEELMILQEEADAAVKTARRHVEAIAAALAHKYGARGRQALAAEGKDTGTVRFDDGSMVVIFDQPKKVEWDTAKLRAAFDSMSEEEARHYAKVTLAVDERKFSAAPPAIRALLEPARQIKAGAPKIGLEPRRAA